MDLAGEIEHYVMTAYREWQLERDQDSRAVTANCQRWLDDLLAHPEGRDPRQEWRDFADSWSDRIEIDPQSFRNFEEWLVDHIEHGCACSSDADQQASINQPSLPSMAEIEQLADWIKLHPPDGEDTDSDLSAQVSLSASARQYRSDLGVFATTLIGTVASDLWDLGLTLAEGTKAIVTDADARKAAWKGHQDAVDALGQRWYNEARELGYSDQQIGDKNSMSLLVPVAGDSTGTNNLAEYDAHWDFSTNSQLEGTARDQRGLIGISGVISTGVGAYGTAKSLSRPPSGVPTARAVVTEGVPSSQPALVPAVPVETTISRPPSAPSSVPEGSAAPSSFEPPSASTPKSSGSESAELQARVRASVAESREARAAGKKYESVAATQATSAVPQKTVDKSWKSIIEGKPHKTGTEGHMFRSYREAIKMAKSGEYEKVRINRAYSTTTGTKTSPRRLPDVIAKRKTGQVDAVEVPSKTDDPLFLRQRNDAAMKQLPIDQQGDIEITPIRKGIRQ